MRIDLQISLEEKDFERLVGKYHFDVSDLPKIKSFYQAVWPLLNVHAFYEQRNASDEVLFGVEYKEYLAVFLTVGIGIDELQDFYEKRQCIFESYILDCIGLEIMMKAYEQFIKKVQSDFGMWAQKIDFFGDTYPVELMKEWLSRFDETDIFCNEKYVLSPSKSVAFLLPMKKDERPVKNPCHICENCGRTQCMFRETVNTNALNQTVEKEINKYAEAIKPEVEVSPKPYGYTRIFGNRSRLEAQNEQGRNT